MHLRQMKLDYL